jgi:Domain of unknown function (DUF5666)
MNFRLLSAITFGLAVSAAAYAQDAPAGSPAVQTQNQGTGGSGGGQGQRGGRGAWGGGMGMGRGVMGTVTEVAGDHYTIKTEAGETYTVHYSANTRILKQPAQRRGGGEGRGQGEGGGGNPLQVLKATDIKVGDAVAAMGEIDATGKSVGAVTVMQIDPERAKQMREMQANFGKTWLAGKVTAVDGVKVTVQGGPDNGTHTFMADENTTFRKRRDPITLADIQVGEMIRVEGGVKDGGFVASAVMAMGAPQGGGPRGPGGAQPQ